jgi:hypothetical protein
VRSRGCLNDLGATISASIDVKLLRRSRRLVDAP